MISRFFLIAVALLACEGIVRAQTATQTAQEVQLVQTSNGNSFAFRAGASTVQQTITWPAALPTTGQYLKVASVSGSNVTLEWGAGTGGGGGGSSVPLVDARTTAVALTTAMQNVLTVTADADQVYRFSGRFQFTLNNPTTINAIIDWTLPAGATIDYVWVNESTGTSGQVTGAAELLIPLSAAGQSVYVGGRINMGGTGGNIVLRARRPVGSTALTFAIGSYLNYVP